MGEGAGRLPTANSVVSDIISIVMKNDNEPFPEETWSQERISDYKTLHAKWFEQERSKSKSMNNF